MSDITTVAVLLGVLALGHLSIYFSAVKALDMRDAIVTGFVRGAPEPMDLRVTRLFITWFPLGMFTGAYAFIFGVGLWLFAQNIGNEKIRLFGYWCSAQACFAALFIVCLTVVDVVSLRRRLSKIEAA